MVTSYTTSEQIIIGPLIEDDFIYSGAFQG